MSWCSHRFEEYQKHLLNTSVPLSGQRFVTGLDILVPGDYELEVRYKGGTEVSKEKTISGRLITRELSRSLVVMWAMTFRDGVDQNCDGGRYQVDA